MSYNKSIVVIDSGIGGLYILKECCIRLKECNYIYVADNLNAPYGNKSKKELNKIAYKLIAKLDEKYHPTLYILACNTLTVNCIEFLRKNFKKQFVGIEPALKIARLNGGKTILFATQSTLKAYKKLNRKITKELKEKFKENELIYKNNDRIFKISIPKLPTLIDKHCDNLEILMPMLLKKFQKHRIKNISNLVLGCTHYIALKNKFKTIFGNEIQILDGAIPVAKRAEYLIKNLNEVENKFLTKIHKTKLKSKQKNGFTKIKFICTNGNIKQKNKLKNYYKNI